MGSSHLEQVCGRSNSSEKISLTSPHLGHSHVNDLRVLKFAYPGQCCGVEVVSAIITSILVFKYFTTESTETAGSHLDVKAAFKNFYSK